MSADQKRDYGGASMAVLLIGFGAFAIYDTTGYADPDSAVFPRTVAMGLIAVSSVYLTVWLMGRADAPTVLERGSWPRRLAFVAVMLIAAFAMPWIGFVPVALASFGLLMMIAMFDAWTLRRAAIYILAGLIIVFGFYGLFGWLLQVPLPRGWLFQG